MERSYSWPECVPLLAYRRRICVCSNCIVRPCRSLVTGFSLQRAGFARRAYNVAFVVDKVPLGKLFFTILSWSSLSISFRRRCTYAYVFCGVWTMGPLAALLHGDVQLSFPCRNNSCTSKQMRHPKSNSS